eukprot:m.189966 g.189966  ORF g.189966 m.189966 type:complete len:570 (-) comp10574_c0_seq4:96-1805(-)
MTSLAALAAATRRQIAEGALRGPTSGLCRGLLQANIVILHEEHADAFEAFCRQNARACPLLYRSKAGARDAPPLTAASDIATDVPRYHIWEHGVRTAEVTDISDLWHSSLTTFYLGCSFSFEEALLAAGVPVRNIEQKCNVPMYRTNRACVPAGPFRGNLVVSLRPVPADLVDTAFATTAPLLKAHGAPIHCGAAADLGIADLATPDFGDAVTLQDGDVPCFWACGVTSLMAVEGAKLPFCITHAPGHMFITDVQFDSLESLRRPEDGPYDNATIARLCHMERVIAHDPGQRGVAALRLVDQLVLSAQALASARHVGLITGFPCLPDPPHTETDGPPGVVALARSLVALGKKATLITDKVNEVVLRAALDASDVAQQVELKLFAAGECASSFLQQHELDHLVALERAGRAQDGEYYTMSARNMSALVEPLDELFLAAASAGVATTGIGDGGNEMGMGRLKPLVHMSVRHGEKIACTTTADHTMVAGVSNWGGYALGAALAVLHRAKTGEHRESALPSLEHETRVLRAMNEAGAQDGITRSRELEVDGFHLNTVHQSVIEALCRLAMHSE